MPLVVIDARGITFRPSGARTRLLSLMRAYVQLPTAFDVVVVASRGRGAADLLSERGIPCAEREPPTARSQLAACVRVTGPVFERADLVHRETYPVPLAQGVPTLVTIHDLRSTLQPGLSSSKPKAVYERWILPRIIRRVDHVIAVSKSTAADVRSKLRIPADRVSVVANAIDPPDNEALPTITPVVDGPFVLALGHMEPRKNLVSLIPAMERVAETISTEVPKLVIAGRDFGEADRVRAAYEGLPHRTFELVLLTQVDEATKQWLLAHARCVVTPSLGEGFGLVPLEALAAGTPVIGAEIPAIREVLGAGADLVDPNDPHAMGDAIRRMLLDNAHRSLQLQVGRTALERYSWTASASSLHRVYERLLVRQRHLRRRS